MSDNLLSYKIKPMDNYIFLRDVLRTQMEISRSLLTKLKQQHKIRVNGQSAFTNYKVQAGDVIIVDLALEEESKLVPYELPLDIIYEDLDFLVINKPHGLAVHPMRDPSEITLANAVTYYWVDQGIYPLFRPINRLDKDTSGLILIGKSKYAHQAIFRQMKQGKVKRTYQALIEGEIGVDSGCIDLPIAHLDPHNGPQRSVSSSGKRSVTNFTVIKRYADFSLLSVTLGTGRTHQIRVHLSHVGHPLCGDTLYGSPSPLITRQALHAGQLAFIQPRTGTLLEFEAPLPSDILDLLGRLKPLS